MSNKTTFSIPIILIKEQEQFIISCDTLGIYSQSEKKEKAQQNFESCVDILFKKWEADGSLINRLIGLGLLETSKKKSITIKSTYTFPKLKLGNMDKINGSLVAC